MDAAAAYNRLVERDLAAAAAQAAWQGDAFARAGILFDGVPMRSFIRPHFVERPRWNVLRDSGRKLLELAARVARQVFDGDARRLCAWLGTPEAEVPWIVLDPGEPDVVLSRLDAFSMPEGPRFIEINSDAPAGFGYGDRMAAVFEELPLFREFSRSRRVSYLPSAPRVADAIAAAWKRRGGVGVPLVAIADWAEVRTRPDQEILRQAFEARGLRCVLADPREMEIARGRLVAQGSAVDVVYRRGVLSELVERADAVRDFMVAYRDGLALFVNSFRCHLSEDKAFFALLGDEEFQGFMSQEERRLVVRCIPWTRKLEERRTLAAGRTIDLVPHVIEHRERLVLKPAHGYGGRSVYVGDETTPRDWDKAVAAGIGRPWVVQERVAIPEEVFPVCADGGMTFEKLKVNANPFYVAGAEVGAVTRASRSSVINVSAGGGSVPTFVVE